MRKTAVAAAVICLLSAATFPGAKWFEERSLQGQWIVVSSEAGGRQTAELSGALYVFTGEKLEIHAPYYELAARPFQVDPGKTPKELDVFITPTKVVRAIYQLDGDNLTICSGDFRSSVTPDGNTVLQPGARPKTFDSRAGSLLVLRRQRPPDGKTQH